MKAKTFLGFAAAAAAAMVAASASAKTVLWYHFDERGNGERASNFRKPPDMIVNAADPGNLDGRPGGLSVATPPAFYSNYTPTYTNDFPSYATWYDPVTGARGTNRLSLWLMNRTAAADAESSVVLVDDDEKLHCANSITVEFMAKLKPGLTIPSSPGLAYMAMMHSSTTTNFCSWGLMAYQSGNVFVRMQTRSSDDATTLDASKSFSELKATASVMDGNWHHIAFTYDGSTVKLYVDYTLKASKSWSYPIDYSEACNGILSLGAAYMEKKGRWNGFIDEFRISDEALDPSQFIHPGGIVSASLAEKIAAVTDEDTALYMPFDSVEAAVSDPFFGGVGAPFVFNALNASNAPIVKATFPTSGMLPTTSAATVSNIVHSGIFATNSVANGGCWDFGVNSSVAGRSIHMSVDDYSMHGKTHAATSGDFTMEFFVKTHARPSKLTYLVREICPGSTAWYMYLSSSKDALVCGVAPQTGSASSFEANFTQGVWHHVALVVNRTLRTATFYLDGSEKGKVTGFDLKQAAGDVAECLHLSGYSASDGTDNLHNISIDELRITKRALEPQEFLATGAAAEFEPTRMWVGFEGDLSVEPRPDEIQPGVVATNAAFSDVVWGDGTIQDGAGNVLRATNTKSMRFSGGAGKTYFTRNLLIEKDLDSQTVEFFMKAPKGSATAWAYMLRAYTDSSMGDATNKMCWTIGYHDTAGHIYVGAVTSEFPDKSVTRYFEDGEHDLDDGYWHHVAVTFEPDNTTNTLITFYKDYKQCGTSKSVNGRLKHIAGEPYMRLGVGNYFNGWIDELRISKGVLTPEQMLHVGIKYGAVMILR